MDTKGKIVILCDIFHGYDIYDVSLHAWIKFFSLRDPYPFLQLLMEGDACASQIPTYSLNKNVSST